MKKLIAMLLAIVMCMSLFAGCVGSDVDESKGNDDKVNNDDGNNNNDDGDDLYAEHVTLTYCFPDAMGVSEYANWQDIVDAINEITEEKINATINVEIIPLGEYTDKMNMKYVAGEEFDVCFTGAWNNYSNAVTAGGFYELTTDMIQKYAAETYEVLNKDSWDAVTIDGKIYGVPLQQIWVRQNAIRFNTDLADKYGFDYTTVKDLADITPYLETLKNAGEKFIIHANKDSMIINLSMYMGLDMLVDYTTPGAVYYADSEAKVVNQFATEEFLAVAKQYKAWADAGYIRTDALDKSVDELSLYAVDINPAYKPGGDATEAGTRGYGVASMPIGSTALTTSGIVATNLAVGATSKNPERALAFINLLNTNEELLNLICHGIEGTDWTYADEDNKVITIAENAYPGNYSFLVGNVFNEYYTDATQVGSWEETAELNGSAAGSCILGFTFNAEPVSNEIAAMQAVVAEKLPAISIGQVDDVEAAIADLNAALEKAGLQTVLDEMQSQINAWLGK